MAALEQLDVILERYNATRAFTAHLAQPLSPEDCQLQSMPDASPTKWHLAHTTWFFETFVLAKSPGYELFHPAYSFLFNSYYDAVGARHPRQQRGILSRPSLSDILDYRRHVDDAMNHLLSGATEEQLSLVVLGCHHEQQHQELLLTDIKHAFSQNSTDPVYRTEAPVVSEAASMKFQDFEGGLKQVGREGGFCFDNEQPVHSYFLSPFSLASRKVTNAEYQEFIAAGGYRDPKYWLSDGWHFIQKQEITGPLYWALSSDAGIPHSSFSLHGRRALDPNAPVNHVSFYEADAYATFRGCRLPTEQEWEVSVAGQPPKGRFSDEAWLEPVLDGASSRFGDGWEWTQSAYAPYPGFVPAEGAVGEYNGKFMSGQMVLRGGSVATAPGHLRASYRNFFPPGARWQYSTIRLAKNR